MNIALDWLMSSPGWMRYRAIVDLQGKAVDSGAAVSARLSMVKDPLVNTLIEELKEWPGAALSRHNDAGHLLHKLVFLADAGMHYLDSKVGPVIEKVLENPSPEGHYKIMIKTAVSRGGDGEAKAAWMLCDAPSVLYCLAKMGFRQDERIKKAAGSLVELARGNGWPCVVSPEMGKFRGPGRAADPCPYATLISLKALAQIPDYKDHEVCHNGAEALLNLWAERKERKAYLFGMGTDFAKLKAPLVWYDILHVTDVLTQFSWLKDDPRLQEMLEMIEKKADSEGRFKAESIWKAWSEWDFGQKKEPSYWITFLASRVLKRVGRAE